MGRGTCGRKGVWLLGKFQLVLDLGSDDMGKCTLGKPTLMYTDDLCLFLYVCYTSMKTCPQKQSKNRWPERRRLNQSLRLCNRLKESRTKLGGGGEEQDTGQRWSQGFSTLTGPWNVRLNITISFISATKKEEPCSNYKKYHLKNE